MTVTVGLEEALSPGCTVVKTAFDRTVISSESLSACDRQTDGQTDTPPLAWLIATKIRSVRD